MQSSCHQKFCKFVQEFRTTIFHLKFSIFDYRQEEALLNERHAHKVEYRFDREYYTAFIKN